MERESNVDWLIGLLGALASLAAAGLLAEVRDSVGSTNIALALALVVMIAGVLGRRRGALTTAVVAALSFNFFQTEPIHSLRISSAKDVYTVVLLLLVGVVVGELANQAYRALDEYRAGHSEVGLLHATADATRTATSPNAAIFPAVTAVGRLLNADTVTFQRDGESITIPDERVINRNGTTGGIPYRVLPEGYDLGSEPVTVEVAGSGRVHGHIVVTPTAGVGVGLDRRLGAVTIAAQLAMALDRLEQGAGRSAVSTQ